MKVTDIKPDTIYLVDWNPNRYNMHGAGYVQTRKKIVPQLKNGWVWNGWKSIKPTKKDRLSVRPVTLVNDEWVFDPQGECYTEKGEWGQIQTRNILSEANVDRIHAAEKAVRDANRAVELVKQAVSQYADNLARGDGSSPTAYAEEVTLLRSIDLWLHHNNRSLSGNYGGGWDIDGDRL
tara:strand:- start:7642 stop:8178 length:537 start_codon:yes stop_codon:yes gene_type:complete